MQTVILVVNIGVVSQTNRGLTIMCIMCMFADIADNNLCYFTQPPHLSNLSHLTQPLHARVPLCWIGFESMDRPQTTCLN